MASSARRLLDKRCGWCGGPVEASRVDAVYCSTSHRQAAHRAHIRRATIERNASPLSFAYADPPYPGKAWLYRDHPDYGGEVELPALVSRLERYDGWALSTSAATVGVVLELAPTARVAVWIRGARPHATAPVLNAWEAVVHAGGRRVASKQVRDVLEGVTPRRRTTHPGWLVGSKPPRFCEWVFDLLGAGHHPDDTLDDLYPGSGIVARSWALRVAAIAEATDQSTCSRRDAFLAEPRDASRSSTA